MSREYGEYCPISLGAEVFAERWTPLILRNLMLGAFRFSDILAGAPGLPRSVLVGRLRQLEADGVITKENSGLATEYHLTEAGHELAGVAVALGNWGAKWRRREVNARNPYLVLWTLAHLIPADELPRPQVVVAFEVSGVADPSHLWLVATHEGNDVFVEDPGVPVDGVVSCDAETLIEWHSGSVPLATAVRTGRMSLEGPRWLTKVLSGWGRLNPFAGVRSVVA